MIEIRGNASLCRGCRICVAFCPCGALVFQGETPQVLEDKCLSDGHCVAACPHGLIRAPSQLEKIRAWLTDDYDVAVSLAPSYSVLAKEPLKIVAALRGLGFCRVEETISVLEDTVRSRILLVEQSGGPVFSSSCPAVAALIQGDFPHLVPYLAPLPSPMVAHSRVLRKKLGPGGKVVFIGPCQAKKREAATEKGAANGVLTFTELWAWLQDEGIQLDLLPEEMMDGDYEPTSRIGLLAMTISGLDRCRDYLAAFRPDKEGPRVLELLACAGGCLYGPGMPPVENREMMLLDQLNREGGV
ncbi:MAG: 4Fe-4S dicluster domain-containing protein [Firmicutes bacterium]|nr:4Fe-4S dicluster domain-containing protein [Bacillota bacterium]